MNRLFISLYIFIVCGLFAINFVSEQVWQTIVGSESEQLTQTRQVVELLPKLITTKDEVVKHVSNILKVPVTIHSMDEFAWLAEQKHRLQNGNSVITFNEAENAIFYVKIPNENSLYQFGPFKQKETLQSHVIYKWLILGFSYLLLAAIIAFWIRPLWRDLTQLNTMALLIADGDLDIQPELHAQSPINHVVTTFHQMSRRVKRLLDDQKHLVNAVSHELRTPLSRLRFALAISPGIDTKAVQGMESDLKEIETLIDEMLGYARLENMNPSIECESVDLSNSVTLQINKLSQHHDIEFERNIPQHFIFKCNQKLMDRALQNLLTNAVRYANAKVVISLIINENNVKFIVEDDGLGISETELLKVFEPFYRLESEAESARKSSGGGFGLGLAIVKRICDWHLAKCWVEKSKLGGCKFVLSFPLSK